MKLAIVGATGMVGNVMLEVLSERNLPISELILVASNKSIGQKIAYKQKEIKIISIEEALNKECDIAIFAAGGETSLIWAEKFAKIGTTVIDNSSTWRMKENIKLIVPEINANILSKKDKIIANPNCSTIQLVIAISSIHKTYGIKRLVISTYQSVSGSGKEALNQLYAERNGEYTSKIYPHQIDMNCFPHGGDFEKNGYSSEEMKLVNETRKILNDNNIKITSTVVRIPVIGGHSEAVNIELNSEFNLATIIDEISNTSGVKIIDDLDKNKYPMPITVHNKDDVFIGRIRRDSSVKNGLDMWVVADNLRKGAATNAVQIAEYLIGNYLV
jgi:aspartate-semialdehyde dehydrogenase